MESKGKELVKLYVELSNKKDYQTVFCDFLDVCLYFLSAGMLQEDYDRVRKAYSSEEVAGFSKMFLALGDASEGFNDALGEIYMNYVSRGQHGQFFTPMHISDMMALCSGVDNLKPEQSVCDPCCGSGRMLLAAAKICAKNNGNRRPFCYGSDLDLTCVKMAVVNMMLSSIPGEIAWMNSLSMEHWRSYHLGLIKIDSFWLPTIKVTGPGETGFIQRLKISQSKIQKAKTVHINMKPIQLAFDF